MPGWLSLSQKRSGPASSASSSSAGSHVSNNSIDPADRVDRGFKVLVNDNIERFKKEQCRRETYAFAGSASASSVPDR